VENAIRHGVAPRSRAGVIGIRAERLNGSLRLEVRDNGGGLHSEEEKTGNGGVGIANTRARLAHLYGADHRFEMRNLAGGGLLVDITIPFHTDAPAAAEDLKEDEDSRPHR
jgi:LytS/YehU family sensor histidine kinase